MQCYSEVNNLDEPSLRLTFGFPAPIGCEARVGDLSYSRRSVP